MCLNLLVCFPWNFEYKSTMLPKIWISKFISFNVNWNDELRCPCTLCLRSLTLSVCSGVRCLIIVVWSGIRCYYLSVCSKIKCPILMCHLVWVALCLLCVLILEDELCELELMVNLLNALRPLRIAATWQKSVVNVWAK